MIPILSFDYVAAAAAATAVGGVAWGVYQYRKGQITQRQQVLFELVKELNESPDMRLAKEILGYDYKKTKE